MSEYQGLQQEFDVEQGTRALLQIQLVGGRAIPLRSPARAHKTKLIGKSAILRFAFMLDFATVHTSSVNPV